MNIFNQLNQPIKKLDSEVVHANKKRDLAQVIKKGEEKKTRVLNFLSENYVWKIADIVKKFDLDHDVKKDFKNGLVKMCFFADESMRVECFDLTMPYSEVLSTFNPHGGRKS